MASKIFNTFRLTTSGNHTVDPIFNTFSVSSTAKGSSGSGQAEIDIFETSARGHYVGAATFNTFSVTAESYGSGGSAELTFNVPSLEFNAQNSGYAVIEFNTISLEASKGIAATLEFWGFSVEVGGQSGQTVSTELVFPRFSVVSSGGGKSSVEFNAFSISSEASAVNLGEAQITLDSLSVAGSAYTGFVAEPISITVNVKAKGQGYLSNNLAKEISLDFSAFFIEANILTGNIGTGEATLNFNAAATGYLNPVANAETVIVYIEIHASGYNVIATRAVYNDDLL